MANKRQIYHENQIHPGCKCDVPRRKQNLSRACSTISNLINLPQIVRSTSMPTQSFPQATESLQFKAEQTENLVSPFDGLSLSTNSELLIQTLTLGKYFMLSNRATHSPIKIAPAQQQNLRPISLHKIQMHSHNFRNASKISLEDDVDYFWCCFFHAYNSSKKAPRKTDAHHKSLHSF